ncbi:MAG TPA: hypothetical protein PLA50_15850 [Bacteroidia bacterium]|nr:hypothetical protein [Bacteroidia bacterium]
MVHYIALFRVGKGKGAEDLEDLIRESRMCFHQIHEATNVRSGRALDPKSEFPFFLSADFESLDKYRMFRDDPRFVRFEKEVLKPGTTSRVEHLYETDPGKDPKYS